MGETMTYVLALACLCAGALAGATATWARCAREANEPSEFSAWLGRPCWMKNKWRRGKRWLKYRVVAVSHKGGVAVRRWDEKSGGAVWVDKSQVPTHVRFDEPLMGGER